MRTADPGPPPFGLDELARRAVPRIEQQIEDAVGHGVDDPWMRGAIGYQLGWSDADFARLAPEDRRRTGKRLRPLLVLLSHLAAVGAVDLNAIDGGDSTTR